MSLRAKRPGCDVVLRLLGVVVLVSQLDLARADAATQKQEFLAYVHRLLATIQPCEAAVSTTRDVLAKTTSVEGVYAIMDTAAQGVGECLLTTLPAITRLSPPRIPGIHLESATMQMRAYVDAMIRYLRMLNECLTILRQNTPSCET